MEQFAKIINFIMDIIDRIRSLFNKNDDIPKPDVAA